MYTPGLELTQGNKGICNGCPMPLPPCPRVLSLAADTSSQALNQPKATKAFAMSAFACMPQSFATCSGYQLSGLKSTLGNKGICNGCPVPLPACPRVLSVILPYYLSYVHSCLLLFLNPLK